LAALRSFCRKTVEIGWLMLVISIPVALNIYGFNPYDLPKASLFRFITLLMLAAWLVSLAIDRNLASQDTSNPPALRLHKFFTVPLVIPAFLFATVYLLTTITSLNPRFSLWGEYLRVQGTYTTLCYVLFFFLVAFNLRTKAQFDRVVTVALLASLPVAFYGVLQHFGVDPIFVLDGPMGRVDSTMGNPIFLGAYLIMVIPPTLARLLATLPAFLRDRQPLLSRCLKLLQAAAYALLLALQSACLLYTKSRGSWLGFLAGIALFAVLLSLRRRIRWLLVATIATVVAFVVLLVLLNLPHSPLEPLRTLPYLSSLVIIDDLKATTGTVGVRLLIWQGEIELLRSRPPIGLKPDPLSALRPIIGYGPEMMGGIFPAVYSPRLGHIEDRNALADRAHNHLLDLLIMNGALGLLAYLLLIGSFFYYGISLIWRTETSSIQLTLIALLSAVFAHFVEIQVGIALVTTQMLLWLYMALLVVVHRFETSSMKEQVESIASAPLGFRMNLRDPNVRWLIYSLITAFMLIFFATTTNINLIRADINFERCYDLAETGALKEAVDACHQATRLSPNQARYHRLRAELLLLLARAVPDSDVDLKAKLLQNCDRAMAKARQLTPLAAEYYADTGKLYGYWAETIDSSRFEQAVEFYHQAFQIAPHDADIRNGLGHVYFNAGQYEEAIRQYEHSLSIDPQYHATYYDLGLVYVELGGKNKAEEHFKTALLLDPECEECAQRLESLKGD